MEVKKSCLFCKKEFNTLKKLRIKQLQSLFILGVMIMFILFSVEIFIFFSNAGLEKFKKFSFFTTISCIPFTIYLIYRKEYIDGLGLVGHMINKFRGVYNEEM